MTYGGDPGINLCGFALLARVGDHQGPERRDPDRARSKFSLRAEQVLESGGEVILADSFSNDHTVDGACSYPRRVVQFVDRQDRSCGFGAQIGMVAARGDFADILDGDGELLPRADPALSDPAKRLLCLPFFPIALRP